MSSNTGRSSASVLTQAQAKVLPDTSSSPVSSPPSSLQPSCQQQPQTRRRWGFPSGCGCLRPPVAAATRPTSQLPGGGKASHHGYGSGDAKMDGGGGGVISSVEKGKESPVLGQEQLRLAEAANTQHGPFLEKQIGQDVGLKTLVLDLDETLVHSSFRPVAIAAFIVPVEIEGQTHDIYVCKRPGVDEFLQSMFRCYEIVIFTASLAKYADPLMDELDPSRLCTWRLFRESCTLINGSYVKDLSKLGRELKDTVIIDNSPNSYGLQPDNAIPIKSWFDDMNDRELSDLIPILEALARVDDIPSVMRQTLAYESDAEDEDDDE
eukprot:GHVS01098224.1.p2 GENE.GHVS01098224.1~~GHVS01098224.1.p2  ORF type:complete len:322 (-),score=56.93 GHVS01098224.1:1768-2733(-)